MFYASKFQKVHMKRSCRFMYHIKLGHNVIHIIPSWSICLFLETRVLLSLQLYLFICLATHTGWSFEKNQLTWRRGHFSLTIKTRGHPPRISKEAVAVWDLPSAPWKCHLANRKHLVAFAVWSLSLGKLPVLTSWGLVGPARLTWVCRWAISQVGPGQTLLINHGLNLSQRGDLRLDIIWKQIGWKIALTIRSPHGIPLWGLQWCENRLFQDTKWSVS